MSDETKQRTLARATEQRREDAIYRAVAGIVGEEEPRPLIGLAEAERPEFEAEWLAQNHLRMKDHRFDSDTRPNKGE